MIGTVFWWLALILAVVGLVQGVRFFARPVNANRSEKGVVLGSMLTGLGILIALFSHGLPGASAIGAGLMGMGLAIFLWAGFLSRR